MNHLNEGTIHAWLDGALGAPESREIEAHLVTCAACSAAVAEARGLVAGASRILNALDDVPAGVMPKHAPARPSKRQWRAAPWVTGIAAALVLAVGITTFDRDGVVAPAKNSAAIADSIPLVAGPAPIQALAQPSAVAADRAPSAPPRAVLADESTRRDRAMTRSRSVRPSDPASGAPGVGIGAGVAAGAQIAAAADQKLERVAVTSAPVAAEAITMQKGAAEFSEGDRFAGCYAMRGEQRTTVLRGAVTEAVAGRAAVARAADQPSAPKAQYVAPRPPDVIRLDTVQRVPMGLLVRSAASDSTIGSWRVVPGDSVRVNLLSAGVFTIAGKDRVACPER